MLPEVTDFAIQKWKRLTTKELLVEANVIEGGIQVWFAFLHQVQWTDVLGWSFPRFHLFSPIDNNNVRTVNHLNYTSFMHISKSEFLSSFRIVWPIFKLHSFSIIYNRGIYVPKPRRSSTSRRWSAMLSNYFRYWIMLMNRDSLSPSTTQD